MENKRINVGAITIVLLSLSILIMSVAYAARSQVLDINGSTTIGENPIWDVHFANINTNTSIDNSFIYTPATIANNTSTYVTYDIKLPKYKDFYEFTLDIVNAGNLDAKIGSVILNGSDNYNNYLKYTVVYTDTNEELKEDDPLLNGESKNIKVRIENIYELNPAELGEVTFNMAFAIQYNQK